MRRRWCGPRAPRCRRRLRHPWRRPCLPRRSPWPWSPRPWSRPRHLPWRGRSPPWRAPTRSCSRPGAGSPRRRPWMRAHARGWVEFLASFVP
ncbi:MAG: hypothetical protein D6798_05060 [Deltaproteobacteria bacterium]|nr:MAG: hypothetical protein D6798_05060 [Deltaproteobacteria bacterium]